MEYAKTNEQVRAQTFVELTDALAVNQVYYIELDQEDDGRIIADCPQFPGVIVYGKDREDVLRRIPYLALQLICQDLAEGKQKDLVSVSFQVM